MVSVASNIQSYGDRTEADPYRQSSRSLGTVDARAYVSEWPDLSVGLLHVSCVLVYDPVKSTVFDRFHDVIIICDIDDGWLVEVVPFELRRRRRERCVWVPVAVVPFDHNGASASSRL